MAGGTMTNNVVSFDYNGVKVVKDSSTKIKHLKYNSSAADTKSLLDVETGSAYQVPAGKKCTIIFGNSMIDGGAICRLSTTTAVDATTGEVAILAAGKVSAMNTRIFIAEAAENLFFTSIATGANAHTIDITAIEETA